MASYLKTPIVRSEAYRRYVASHPCFACGIEGYSQCAHANFGKGLAMKSSDLNTFPLCGPRPGHMGCHTMHDLGIDMTRGERRYLELAYVDRMQAIASKDGRPEFMEAA